MTDTTAPKVNRPLTIKQEKFCQAYVETGNASEAFRRAYSFKNQKPATVNRNAFELTQNPKILARVDNLKAQLAERLAVTVESLSKELDEARQAALQNGQAGAMVAATLGKAKLHGMLVEKINAHNTNFVVEAPKPAPTTDAWLVAVASDKGNDRDRKVN